MIEQLSAMVSRHPCPPGYTPRKSDLGRLIDRYGVGKIPLDELHRANSVTPTQWAAMQAKAAAEARSSAASTARRQREDRMAEEWEASRWQG